MSNLSGRKTTAQSRLENLRKSLKEEANKKEVNDSLALRKLKFKEKKKNKKVQQNIKIKQTLDQLQEVSPKTKNSNKKKDDADMSKPAKKKRIVEKDDSKCEIVSGHTFNCKSMKKKKKNPQLKQSLNTTTDTLSLKSRDTSSPPWQKQLERRFQEEASAKTNNKYSVKKSPPRKKLLTNEPNKNQLAQASKVESTYSLDQFKNTSFGTCSNISTSKKPTSPTKAFREIARPVSMPKEEKEKIVTQTGKNNLYKRKLMTDTNNQVFQKKKTNTLAKYCNNIQEKITSSFKSLTGWSKSKEDPIASSTSCSTDMDNYQMEFELDTPLIVHLQNVRNLVNSNDSEEMDWEISFANDFTVNFAMFKKNVYVVVDTNVFLSSIALIKKIGSVKIGDKNIIIFVPWQVLKELDYLKKDKSVVSYKARQAIMYLFNAFSASDPCLLGQTVQSANSPFPGFEVEVADDHLIKCCLQLKCENQNVILLTNDKNLAVKSFVQSVCVMNAKQLAEVVKIHSPSDPGKEEILHQVHPIEKQHDVGSIQRPYIIKMMALANIFKEFLSVIIEKYLRGKYGEIWTWYLPQKLPLSILQLLLQVREMSNFFPQDVSRHISLYSTLIENILKKHDNDLWFSLYECEQFGKCCYNLITSFSFGFKDEVDDYDRQTAFYKCKNSAGPDPGSTYHLECCKTAMRHFDLFHDKLTVYCCWLSNVIQVPFIPINQTCSLIKCVDSFTIAERTVHKEYVSQLFHSLKRISEVPIQNVTTETKGVQEVYKILVKYGGANCEEDFSFEDVLEFAKDESVRMNFPTALELLYKILIFL